MTELQVPTAFKTSLPPRKRAKTKEEKEQRRIERILRNRKAAHASREKKRRHVEFLESYTTDLESQLQLFKNLSEQLVEKSYQRGDDAAIDALLVQMESLPDLRQRKLDHTKANNVDDDEDQEHEDDEEEDESSQDSAEQPKAKRAKKSSPPAPAPSAAAAAAVAAVPAIKIESSPVPSIPQFDMPNTPESYMSPNMTHDYSRSNSIVSFHDPSSSEQIKQEDEDFSFYTPSLDRDENRYSLDIKDDHSRSMSSSPLPIPDLNLDLLPSTIPNDEKFINDIQQGSFTFDNDFVFDELRNPEVITSIPIACC